MIFRLTDVADDGCLSKKAILKMISRIERNFAKENCPIEINSSTILQEMANKKAQRKYRLLMQKLDLDKANIENKQEADEDFITYEEFLDALKKRDELYKSFLPDNQQMIKVLVNYFNLKEENIIEYIEQHKL